MEAEIDLRLLRREGDFLARAELLQRMIEAVDTQFMPPEEDSLLTAPERRQLLEDLRHLLNTAIARQPAPTRTPIRRLNRFQYNNAVQDLFRLNVVVFPLPERMMREHDGYFQPQTGKMPDTVRVGSRPLGKSQLIERRLGGVTAFPQDLRAEHGFDNRGDHLTLSPLLLESYLRLARSILFSPDFEASTCGRWRDWFEAPGVNLPDAAIDEALRERIRSLLTLAFRRPPTEPLLSRYCGFAKQRLEAGVDFPAAMRDTAAAVIASPRFFYLYERSATSTPDNDSTRAASGALDPYDLATRLSFFLWGSIPDEKLLDAAGSGKLSTEAGLERQVKRMLSDRKLKRFCDSFPSQWLQLERIISSTPDRERFPQFYFLKYRASMHMMLEPLLVFETILIENRPITQLIDSDFSYRSNLLKAWYRDGSQGQAGSPVVVTFDRTRIADRRQGGVLTTAAVMTMTSGVHRTKPITRGAWVATVFLNAPPEPPPADVPPLNEAPTGEEKHLTLRERLAAHRDHKSCAGCHRKIDPLGFALENYNAAGIWRDRYDNGREIDSSGELFGRHPFGGIVEFKDALLNERDRFARAFAAHLLSFSLGREVSVSDTPSLDAIIAGSAADDYALQTMIKQLVLSDSFRRR